MSVPVPPSGDQFEITCGDHSVVVAAVGGGLRAYGVAGRPVLDGYPADAMCDGARGQTLVPWPNRVKDGQWTWRGEQRQLALTEPEQHNAIHGLVRWLPWRPVDRSPSSVILECTSYPQPGYPWPLTVRNTYTIGDEGLHVLMAVTNVGVEPAPVAAGMHPYITVGTPTVDPAVLRLPADTWLPTGDQQIPTGREPVAGTAYDFRAPREIGDVEIDYTFTDLRRDPDGRCRLQLRRPDGEPGVTVWVGPDFDYLEVFTGDTLPDPQRRRRGLGVEPMTAPPNAFASGESLVVLKPDETWTGEWGIYTG